MTHDTKNNLVGMRIGLELLNRDKVFGRVFKWSELSIWVLKDGSANPIEIPRDIIVRSLILLDEVEHEKD